MKNLIIYMILLISVNTLSQNLTLDQCYQLVNTNYPLAKQRALFEKQHKIDLKVIETEKLPQFDLSAQATYQSDVTEVPIPNSTLEPLNKDQYRATTSLNQLIYDGGIITASLDAKNADLKSQLKQVEVNLYQLKKQVNQTYFSILLKQENKALLNAKKEQLQVKLKEIRSGINNGTMIPTSDKVLSAELIKIEQQITSIDHDKSSLIQTLSSLIGKDISPNRTLENSEFGAGLQSKTIRPELELFQIKKEQIEISEKLISKQNTPKIFGFVSGGYGNPGLNMLDNSFQAFYIVGMKLNWNIFDWNANKKKRESLSIKKEIIDNEAEIFKLNTQIELEQLSSEIQKLKELIISDSEIILLRKDILKSAESQLKNGVITTSAYIIELTNLYENESKLNTHKIQLQLIRANYKITQGI